MKAYDDTPGAIRATLSERDSYTFTDDYVRFILDTFNDQRRAYVFTVNPRGVQHDGLWNESGGGTGQRGRRFGSPIDDAPDFLWWSDAHLTEWGYQAELRMSVQEPPLPGARGAGVGPPGRAQHPAQRVQELLGADHRERGEQARPDRPAR